MKGMQFLLSSVIVIILSFPIQAQNTLINVYGPGGPLGPMKECGEIFSQKEKVEVKVTAGPTPKWLDQAKQDADLFFGGAEYMLTEFAMRNPGLVDEKSRVSLYIRPAGILVKKGNPKKITSIQDLAKPGIRIVDVNGAGQLGLWEDLAGRLGVLPQIQSNIVISVGTSAEAIEKWKAGADFDAWITYASWHYRLKEDTDLVEIPEKDTMYRGTPIAIAANSKNKEVAKKFIDFLKSNEGHAVFKKWGWK